MRAGHPLWPGDQSRGGAAGPFSVDVVQMDNLAGPHHIHDTGEIGLIMPISGPARLTGWRPAGMSIRPARIIFRLPTGGSAFILYLLPDGKISFTGKKAAEKRLKTQTSLSRLHLFAASAGRL